jgi:hypothetical protein
MSELKQAIEAAAMFKADSYVQNGPQHHTPAEAAQHRAKIEAARERMKAATTYPEFENAMKELHSLGVFLEDQAVSRVAAAAVTKRFVLRDVPNTIIEDFWKYIGNRRYLVWPADAGTGFARVLVGVDALGEYDGNDIGVDSTKAKAALEKHRDVIQRLAQSKFREGVADVVLEVDDFPPKV